MAFLAKGIFKLAYNEFCEIESDLNERIRCIKHSYDPNLELLNRLLAYTLNNIGCYYKKIAKSSTALKYLEKALDIIIKLDQQRKHLEIKANIFLNLSSVHSLRSRHDIALDYCSKAISILTDLYNKIKFSENNGTSFNDKTTIDANQPYTDVTDASSDFVARRKEIKFANKYNSEDENLITSLIIAYFNLGVECDYMNERQESIRYLKLAYDISLGELGPSAFLTNALSKRIESSSTNPSEVDKPIMEEEVIKSKRGRHSRKRRNLKSKSRKQLNLSSIDCGNISQICTNQDYANDHKNINSRDLLNESIFKQNDKLRNFTKKHYYSKQAINSNEYRSINQLNNSRSKLNNSALAVDNSSYLRSNIIKIKKGIFRHKSKSRKHKITENPYSSMSTNSGYKSTIYPSSSISPVTK